MVSLFHLDVVQAEDAFGGGVTFQTAVDYGCAVEVRSGFADLDTVDG